jgi:ketosteroid isomerase-like protein
MSKGNTRPFVDSFADDIRWTVMGTTRWSKTYEGKQAVIAELLVPLSARFADQYTATAERIIAEGDHVVVEVRGRVTTKSGKPYNNTYCNIFRIVDGKVRELTEYMDTELASSVLSD